MEWKETPEMHAYTDPKKPPAIRSHKKVGNKYGVKTNSV
jgi:hypothetical protein